LSSTGLFRPKAILQCSLVTVMTRPTSGTSRGHGYNIVGRWSNRSAALASRLTCGSRLGGERGVRRRYFVQQLETALRNRTPL